MGTTVVCTNTQKRWSTSKENKTTKDPRPDGRGHGWLGYKDSNLNCLIQSQMYYRYTIPHRGQVVPMKRFELLRGHPHYALNVARLPVPPHRRSHLFLSYCTRNARGLSNPIYPFWGNKIHRSAVFSAGSQPKTPLGCVNRTLRADSSSSRDFVGVLRRVPATLRNAKNRNVGQRPAWVRICRF